jgi:hypothetical protein
MREGLYHRGIRGDPSSVRDDGAVSPRAGNDFVKGTEGAIEDA